MNPHNRGVRPWGIPTGASCSVPSGLNGTSAPLRAFTLIELLVVIAILGILSALLLSAISRADHAAKATECRQNLRDLGLAMRMFVDESNQYPTEDGTINLLLSQSYPGWRDPTGYLVYGGWKMDLAPYLGAQIENDRTYVALRKLRCPQMTRSDNGPWGNGQYAYNASGTAPINDPANLGLGGYMHTMRRTPESLVKAPADMIALGDIEPAVVNKSDLFWSSGFFDPLTTNRIHWPNTSHSGQANMLFCDGHVESARQTNWLSTNYAARARWNNDHQPHPETWNRP
jgi:prepilin-type processing-associated H-X9-DG protein/prepilin-type N-terminal cleavage/methylation domain-containing protein